VVSDEPLPKPATETAETRSAEAKSVELEVRKQPDASPSLISEVIPSVPRSARETIRGTVRVSVRVIVDKEGTVLVATADDPGPSRYFERLAIQASKKWTFAPTDAEEQRIMLVRFNFTRAGTTARANSLQ
jgi:TonB family protein